MTKNWTIIKSLFITQRYLYVYIWIILLFIYPFKLSARISDVCISREVPTDVRWSSGITKYVTNVDPEVQYSNYLFFGTIGYGIAYNLNVAALKTLSQTQPNLLYDPMTIGRNLEISGDLHLLLANIYKANDYENINI